eukprot:420846-Pyramimonas_sp.AAC.1
MSGGKRSVASHGHQLVLLALSWASGGSARTLVPLRGVAPLLELNRLVWSGLVKSSLVWAGL